MHHKSCILAAGLSSALAVKAAPYIYARQEASLPAVQANTLVDLVDEAYLRIGAETLQRIADENNGTRAFGTPGYALEHFFLAYKSESTLFVQALRRSRVDRIPIE